MRFHAWSLMLISGLLLVALPGLAQEQAPIPPSGKALLNAALRKKAVTVTIRTVEVENNVGGAPSSSRSVVQDLGISVGANQIFVPRSVFADLIDPREASLRFEKGTLILSVSGGDGADSYVLRVHFDDKRVVRRTLYSSLIPDKAVEETRYWLRILKDE